MSLKAFSLRIKITIFVVVLIVALVSIGLLGLQAMRHASETDNIARINQLMKSTANTITQFESLAESNKLSEEQAKTFATQLLRENKYHDSEYVYVVDDQLNFIATPHDQQLHGTSFNDFKDASGASIGKMVEDLVGNKVGQIITYQWVSERDGEVFELTSVVQKTSTWGWYVGTGISAKEVDERYWSTARWLLAYAAVVAVVMSVILARFGFGLINNLGAEIYDVLKVVKKVSRGNLQSDNKYSAAPTDSIIGAMNFMRQGLQEVVDSIKTVSHSLAEQGSASDQRAIELDRLTESMSQETQVVAATITQLSASAGSVSSLAEQAAVSVKDAEDQGKNAFTLTEESASTMVLLENQIESAGSNIQVLDDEVTNIATVLTVIQSIAEQTNLLALNAAIEAARAGDQGRGFAVVADEVRQLAQRTQASTEEIQQMISKLQLATKDAKQSVTESIDTSEEAVKKSQKVSHELKNIAKSLSEISLMSHQITAAAKEQLDAGEDTAIRVVNISDTAENTAQVSRHAHSSSDQIKLLITHLETEINKFQL